MTRHDLVQAFWSVVCSNLSPEERRLLLLFITGTDRLPEPGCETLSIEVRQIAFRCPKHCNEWWRCEEDRTVTK